MFAGQCQRVAALSCPASKVEIKLQGAQEEDQKQQTAPDDQGNHPDLIAQLQHGDPLHLLCGQLFHHIHLAFLKEHYTTGRSVLHLSSADKGIYHKKSRKQLTVTAYLVRILVK